ncbi:MAG: hypothetical protein QG577_7 [Thermodesulfobacteriota bacterium]|nr:hypothetical protein [Thermodesulfobacteriota bacterium]
MIRVRQGYFNHRKQGRQTKVLDFVHSMLNMWHNQTIYYFSRSFRSIMKKLDRKIQIAEEPA